MNVRKVQQAHGFGIVSYCVKWARRVYFGKMSPMFKDRLRSLRKLLIDQNIDGVIVSSVSNIVYFTGYSNFSKEEREAYLIIGKDFQYIVTDGRYSEAIDKSVPHFTLFERGYKNSLDTLYKKLKVKIKTLGVEEDNLTVSEYKFIKKYFKKIKNCSTNNLRSLKTKVEVDKIKKACAIGDLAFKNIIKKIKVGVSEKEIAYDMEKFIKQKGAEQSFPAIVAFSKNSSIPHHHTGEDILKDKKGQFVLLDFGVKYEGYCSDMTRTIFFGKPSKKQEEIYAAVLNAQEQSIKLLTEKIKKQKSILSSEVDEAARIHIQSKGFDSIPHSVGHGIGLEVHEYPYISPRNSEILKEGMVFSIEPGIYLKDFGGVRIEDLFVYENDGLRQITNASKKITII